jgi:hypothetical protein
MPYSESIRGVVAAWLVCAAVAGCGLGTQALSLIYQTLWLE